MRASLAVLVLALLAGLASYTVAMAGARIIDRTVKALVLP